MPAITQRIPNFLGGVSQQIDTQKQITQLRSCINAYPDVTWGLIKRAGGKFISELKNSGGTKYASNFFDNCKWFTIFRDSVEKYLCVIKAPNIYVWDLQTGAAKTVNYTGSGTTYLNGGSVPEDYHTLSINDYTYITNRKTTVTAQATPGAWTNNKAFINLNTIAYNSTYNVNINGTNYAYATPASGALQVSDITAALAALINGISGFTATVIGPGIYVTNASAFSIAVSGGQTGDAIDVFQQTVSNVAQLPLQCTNGYTVKIRNSNADEDDYYAKFVADNGTSGPGIWEETVAPTVSPGLTASTMPHQLVRNGDGTFTFGPVSYENRIVGDDTTNPQPSFVGQKIRQLFFYRDRFGVLTDSNVVMSQAGDYFNFYGQSALTSTDSDPIDFVLPITKPTTLFAAQPVAQGLVLFGSTGSFLVQASNDSLTPSSVVIRSLAEYQADITNDPVSLGTTTAFITKNAAYTRVFEMETLGSNDTPFVQDVTKVVPEWIPSTISLLAGSGQSNLLALASRTSRDVYLFTFLSDGTKRLLQSWFQWRLSGKVQHQAIDSDVYWVVTQQSGAYVIQSINLVQSPSSSTIQVTDGSKSDPRLSMWSASGAKSLVSGDTKIYLPYTHDASLSLTLVVANSTTSGPDYSNSGTVIKPDQVYSDGGGQYVLAEGRDLTTDNIIVGYSYDYSVELPRFYYRSGDGYEKTDYTAYLTVSRIKFNFGLSGDIGFTVRAAGREDWDETANSILANYYTLNDIPFTANSTFTLPIHQRPENFIVEVTSDSPFPVALNSLMWEGRYSPRFYSRR